MHETAPETGNSPLRWSKLYSLRMRHHYTQQYAADSLGISPATLGRWEKEPDKMHIDDLRKAAEFYKVSAEWLLGPDPVVLNIHNSKVENGSNGGAYHNIMNLVPQEALDRIDKRMDESARMNEELLRLNQRLMEVVERLTGKGG